MPPKKKAAATTAAPEEDVSMADASPAPADVPEPEYDIEIDEQRIRIVSSNPSRYSESILILCSSFQEPLTLQHHLNSRRKIIHWGMLCDISS
jgi:hypothetical protein